MNNVLKDSLRELIVVLKDVKLNIFTLIAIIVPLVLQNFLSDDTVLICIFVVVTLIVSLVFNVYQYITIPKLTTTQEKNLVNFFPLKSSYSSSIGNLVKSLCLLILASLGVIVLVLIILIFIVHIGEESFSFLNILGLGFITLLIAGSLIFIAAVKLYLFIPLTILVDTDRPIKYSLELSKGKFWELALILLFLAPFPLPGLLLNVLKASPPIVILMVMIPLTIVIYNLCALISINTLYYSMNES